MKVLAVVLNYRTPELAVKCLESLESEVARVGDMRVIVTDNDSGDGSIGVLQGAIAEREWGWCTLMPLEKNGGYAFGNNAGIQACLSDDDRPEYVFIVNPDARLEPGAVLELIAFMDAHPTAGVVGARIEGPDGAQQSAAFRFPTVWTELLEGFRLGVLDGLMKRHRIVHEVGERPAEVDWVSGAAMMIRADLFDDIGMLDEGYFLYFEEVDFCLRAKRAGWSTHHVPNATVMHLQAQATGITGNRPKRYPDYWFESRRRFFLKNYGRAHALAADVAFLSGYTTWRIRRVIQRKEDHDPPKFWFDFLRNSTLVKGMSLD